MFSPQIPSGNPPEVYFRNLSGIHPNIYFSENPPGIPNENPLELFFLEILQGLFLDFFKVFHEDLPGLFVEVLVRCHRMNSS